MFRCQASPPPGHLLPAAFAGAVMVQAVLVELGVMSADGFDEINGIVGFIGWLILFLFTGPLFLGAVYAVYGGGWRDALVFTGAGALYLRSGRGGR